MTEVSGIGIGLRMEFADALFEAAPAQIRWLELHPENYLRRGGRYRRLLARAQDKWPLVTHGLTMGFGAVEPYDRDYTRDLRGFLGDVQTPWHSDHLCFASTDGVFLHELMPLPLNEETLGTTARRFAEAQNDLGVPLAVENVSYYAPSDSSESDEITFVTEFLERADARMLLDVNNVYVNSRNFGFDPRAWIDLIPKERVVQIHVAGHQVRKDGFRIDTHAESVCNDVYELLEYTLRRLGPRPVLLERDGNYPDFQEILEEVEQLDTIYQRATAGAP